MTDQFKNFLIGLFVTAAAAIVVFIIMFLNPSVGDEGKIIHVRFADIDKVTLGTRVTYGGKPVGEVIGIHEIEHGRRGKADDYGHVYLYDLTLRVDSGVNVYNSDQVSLRTSGLLGEKNVEITPLTPGEGLILKQIDHEPIYGEESASVEQTLKEFKEIGDKAKKMLDAITQVVNRVSENKLVDKITTTVEHIESIAKALDNPQQWSETLANIHNISVRVNQSWDTVDTALHSFDDAAHAITEAGKSAQGFMDEGKKLVTKVYNGEGTVGRLISSDELYLNLNALMGKAETILDDINHYGLLYQTDKGWQRLRARRLNLLQTLRTPQEFRNYFNDEIDQVTTSLSRVYMVLDQVDTDPYCSDLLANREYTKVFAELIRRVKTLEEEIRLYNMQVTEVQTHQTELGCPCWAQ